MNIYFSCSITGGRQDQQAYQTIVETLLALGHEVPTAMLSSANVMDYENQVDPIDIYLRDTAWVLGCDALIAEVSTPSHGVGYELAMALEKGKPSLCCYRRDHQISKMITGNTMPTITLRSYMSVSELPEILSDWLAQISEKKNTRETC